MILEKEDSGWRAIVSKYATSSDHPINQLVDLCHGASLKAGWYNDPVTGEPIERNVGEMIALAHSELSEALEGYRKGLMDDKLPQHDNFTVELIDALKRIFDLIGYTRAHYPSNPGLVFTDKAMFNATREDHRPEARAANGGKKF